MSNAFDVAVVGGGPAGAVAATTLARLGLDVMLLEATHYEDDRIGETIAPEARPMLARLDPGLLERPELSLPSFGNESSWGSDVLESAPFVFGPYGDGMHVDRKAFDAALTRTAEANGAVVLRGVRVRRCQRAPDGSWRLDVRGAAADALEAAAFVDASGRRAAVSRSLGAERHVRDLLLGITAVYGGVPSLGGSTLVEATHDGWWYSAPLPAERMIVAFMTDADVCRLGGYAQRAVWEGALAATRHTRARVEPGRMLSRPRVASAATQRLRRHDDAGPWLAAGDAAIAIDPLSGSGILRALLTGEAAATAIAHALLGRPRPARAYEEWLDRRFDELWTERAAYYARETRWPDAPFWRRRAELEIRPAA